MKKRPQSNQMAPKHMDAERLNKSDLEPVREIPRLLNIQHVTNAAKRSRSKSAYIE